MPEEIPNYQHQERQCLTTDWMSGVVVWSKYFPYMFSQDITGTGSWGPTGIFPMYLLPRYQRDWHFKSQETTDYQKGVKDQKTHKHLSHLHLQIAMLWDRPCQWADVLLAHPWFTFSTLVKSSSNKFYNPTRVSQDRQANICSILELSAVPVHCFSCTARQNG